MSTCGSTEAYAGNFPWSIALPVDGYGWIAPLGQWPQLTPTDDVRLMTKAAVEAVDRVFRPGFKYSKAEVLLASLCQKGEYTEDLFSISQPAATEKVMCVLDAINSRWGRGTLRVASVPTDPEWGMRREMMSQSFTTRVDQLWTVYCR